MTDRDKRYSYENIPASEWAPKHMGKRFSKAKKAFILAVRMEQNMFFAENEPWCNEHHPTYSEQKDLEYVCSRPPGHDGFHFAQEGTTGKICDIPNNPWLPSIKK